MRRKPVSFGSAKREFRRHVNPHPRNNPVHSMRGGIRL